LGDDAVDRREAEAEAEAGSRFGRLGCEEWVEDEWQHIVRDARSGVCDLKPTRSDAKVVHDPGGFVRRGADCDGSCCIDRVTAVHDEIEQHLLELGTVNKDGYGLRRER